MPTITRDQISTLVPWDTRIPWHADHTDEATMLREAIAPYAALVANFAETTGAASGILPADAPALVADPIRFPASLPRFVAWLRDRNPESSLIPVADAAPDTRRAQGEALAAMRRREADAKRDAHQARQDLVAARVALAEAEERARNLETRMPAVPADFDDSHPGWHEFWLTAARNATREGFCPEYDRMCRLMGGITRDQFRDEGESLTGRESVTYTVTISFHHTAEVDAGDDWEPDLSEALSLARDLGYWSTNLDVEETDREETE